LKTKTAPPENLWAGFKTGKREKRSKSGKGKIVGGKKNNPIGCG